MALKVNENSPDFIARYNQLKALVANHEAFGNIPTEVIVSPATRQFLKESRLNPISAIEQYVSKKQEPPLVYYDYELSVIHRNKFLCLTEYSNHTFFGMKSPTREEARTACAMRCLDFLVELDLAEVMKSPKQGEAEEKPEKKKPFKRIQAVMKSITFWKKRDLKTGGI
uniref:DRBM domain-containing protein n=1 Tax=Acrobeloides nanus TaxID=290746 RepID=A0A914EN29_9BILA